MNDATLTPQSLLRMPYKDYMNLQRLLLRPTAELCAEEKARQEHLEGNFAQRHL